MNLYHKKLASFILVCGALILSFDGYSQEDEIKGRVVDRNGKAVPGTVILIKGTPEGTVTNAEGYFKIVMPNDESTLMFHFIGYKSIEQKMELEKGQTYEIKVTLVEDKKKYLKENSSVEVGDPNNSLIFPELYKTKRPLRLYRNDLFYLPTRFIINPTY